MKLREKKKKKKKINRNRYDGNKSNFLPTVFEDATRDLKKERKRNGK